MRTIYPLLVCLSLLSLGLAGEPVPIKGASGKVVSFDGIRAAEKGGLWVRITKDGKETPIRWDQIDLTALKTDHPSIFEGYEKAQKGETVILELGSYERALINRPITEAIPEVTTDEQATPPNAATELGVLPYRYDPDPNEKYLPFLFYQPNRAVREGDTKIPLVIWLHGQGSGGANNGKSYNGALANLLLTNETTKKECFIMFPQFQIGYNWWDYPDEKRGHQQGIAAAHVLQLIDEICENIPAVDRERIYVAGMSQGSLAQAIWFRVYENLFAGSIQFAGSNSGSRLTENTAVPAWVFYSTDDRVAMQNDTTESYIGRMKEWLPEGIKVTKYTDAGHGGTLSRGLKEDGWIDWLFQQRSQKRPNINQAQWDETFYGK
ncbi:MAG: PHB depolymerase family esterase [Verrucomicrobiota bacterium]